ncbi:MAG: transporter [Alphaproteobacteria bacterium]|nr:transporter [Alphaproteobacteria bacterium]
MRRAALIRTGGLALGLMAGLVTHAQADTAAAVEATLGHNGLNLAINQRPDGHAPISVMGDHRHGEGEVMLSYRFMHMKMEGNRDGTDDLSTQQVLANFAVAPLRMTMDMHMFGLMYGVNDAMTAMVMLPYVEKSMDHVTGMGAFFTTESKGFGDVRLTGMVRLYETDRHRLHLNAGVSLPTGSIKEKDDTPAMANAQLPYPMQIGSGTYDLLPGLIYNGYSETYSWGAQVSGTIRLDENSRDYSLGDRVRFSAWGQRPLAGWLSVSVGVDFQAWGDIDGADAALNPMMVQTADPTRQSGNRTDITFGLNTIVREGTLAGNRLALEFAVPVHQDLDGPQLETDWTITFGWQLAF